jgi:hypothetical protein
MENNAAALNTIDYFKTMCLLCLDKIIPTEVVLELRNEKIKNLASLLNGFENFFYSTKDDQLINLTFLGNTFNILAKNKFDGNTYQIEYDPSLFVQQPENQDGRFVLLGDLKKMLRKFTECYTLFLFIRKTEKFSRLEVIGCFDESPLEENIFTHYWVDFYGPPNGYDPNSASSMANQTIKFTIDKFISFQILQYFKTPNNAVIRFTRKMNERYGSIVEIFRFDTVTKFGDIVLAPMNDAKYKPSENATSDILKNSVFIKSKNFSTFVNLLSNFDANVTFTVELLEEERILFKTKLKHCVVAAYFNTLIDEENDFADLLN